MRSYLPVMMFSSLVGTYVDLIMLQKQFYSYPVRPFRDLFEFNIVFTLLLLPAGTVLFLVMMKGLGKFSRVLLILILGLIIPLVEHASEAYGWFAHPSEWNHFHSVIGYILYLALLWKFHSLCERGNTG